MRNLIFEISAFEELQDWIRNDRKIALKISELIQDVLKNPFTGLGKPEPLKGNYQGYWSRRITDEHRLVYKITNTSIIIASCYSHYKK
jgi:toxin YoeB